MPGFLKSGHIFKFLTGDELERVAESFQTKWGVLQCVEGWPYWYNHTDRKGFYSMLLRGVVDADLFIVFWTYTRECAQRTCVCAFLNI